MSCVRRLRVICVHCARLPSAPGQLWPCSSYCEKSPSTVCDVVCSVVQCARLCTTRARSPAPGGRRAATGKGQQGFPRTQPTTVQCPVTTTTKTTIKNTTMIYCQTIKAGLHMLTRSPARHYSASRMWNHFNHPEHPDYLTTPTTRNT